VEGVVCAGREMVSVPMSWLARIAEERRAGVPAPYRLLR
jgi:hypothetical protein